MSQDQGNAPASRNARSQQAASGRSSMRNGAQKYYVMGSDAPAPAEVRQGASAQAGQAQAAPAPQPAQAPSPARRTAGSGTSAQPTPDVSVVVPVYGCPEALPELHKRLAATLEGMGATFEIILVDDACPLGSWAGIQKICASDPRVQGIRLSRNFGQAQATLAGLDVCRGDWVVVMDCDLQDRPESIAQLYAKAQEGYDVVFARRFDRKDKASTKFLSRAFYKVYDYFTDGHFDPDECNFSISKRIVIDNYCRMREHQGDFSMFVKWLGFNQASISLEADARFAGESSYTFAKKMRMAGALITAQSNKPLYFAVKLGFVIAGLAFIYLVVLLFNYLLRPDIQPGWTSVMGSVFLMGGLILASVGVVGIYIGKIFTEVKGRPVYVVAERLNPEAPKTPGQRGVGATAREGR